MTDFELEHYDGPDAVSVLYRFPDGTKRVLSLEPSDLVFLGAHYE